MARSPLSGPFDSPVSIYSSKGPGLKKIGCKVLVAMTLVITSHSVSATNESKRDGSTGALPSREQQVEGRSPGGARILITQRLTPTTGGKMRYRYMEQSRETQLYHQFHCLEMGGKPASGDTVVGGEATAGFACEMQGGAPAKAGVTIDGIFIENPSLDAARHPQQAKGVSM